MEKYYRNRDQKLSKINTPISTDYRPELDISPELNHTDGVYYQSLIGILRWMAEIDRVDICLEVSIMLSYLVLPREEYLKQVLYIFAYSSKYHNTKIVFDPSDPEIEESDFEKQYWTSSEFGNKLKKSSQKIYQSQEAWDLL